MPLRYFRVAPDGSRTEVSENHADIGANERLIVEVDTRPDDPPEPVRGRQIDWMIADEFRTYRQELSVPAAFVPRNPVPQRPPRGCGYRIAGGIYWEWHADVDVPVIDGMVLDEPIMLDTEALGLTPIAPKLIQRNGVWHVLDWVGEQHYPTVDHFIDEARQRGVSRRLASNFNFARLSPQSMLLLVHRNAVPVFQGSATPHYQPGIFMRVPLERLVWVRDPLRPETELALHAAPPTLPTARVES